jgi:hypothetical protein
MKMAEATYNVLLAYMKRHHPECKPKKSFKEIEPTLRALFRRRGLEDIERKPKEDSTWEAETEARIERWKQQFKDDKIPLEYGGFISNGDKDDWAQVFLHAAQQVTKPK